MKTLNVQPAFVPQAQDCKAVRVRVYRSAVPVGPPTCLRS